MTENEALRALASWRLGVESSPANRLRFGPSTPRLRRASRLPTKGSRRVQLEVIGLPEYLLTSLGHRTCSPEINLRAMGSS